MIVSAQTGATEYGLRIEWVLAFLLSPLCGAFGSRHWGSLGRRWQRYLSAIGVTSVTLAGLTLFTPWSLRGFWPDALNLGLAYVWLSTAIWVGLRKFPKRVSLTVPIIASLLFIPVAFVGLVFASDEIPYYDVDLGNGLSVKTYLRGFAGNDFDQVRIVYRYRWIPILEKTLYDRSIAIDECGEPETPARLTPDARTIEVLCGTEIRERLRVPGY